MIHRRDARGVPRADVSVKGRGAVEHLMHRRDAGGVSPMSSLKDEAS